MNQKCSKCGKVLLTINAFIQEWEADPEPYEADVEQDHEGVSHDLSISSEYCEECQEFTYIWTDPEPVIKIPWISIKDKPLPKDPLIKIIRWNIIHKCEVTVFYYPKHNKNMPWVTGDKSHCWPEETFSPYWKPAPEEFIC